MKLKGKIVWLAAALLALANPVTAEPRLSCDLVLGRLPLEYSRQADEVRVLLNRHIPGVDKVRLEWLPPNGLGDSRLRLWIRKNSRWLLLRNQTGEATELYFQLVGKYFLQANVSYEVRPKRLLSDAIPKFLLLGLLQRFPEIDSLPVALVDEDEATFLSRMCPLDAGASAAPLEARLRRSSRLWKNLMRDLAIRLHGLRWAGRREIQDVRERIVAALHETREFRIRRDLGFASVPEVRLVVDDDEVRAFADVRYGTPRRTRVVIRYGRLNPSYQFLD